ncbi:hypothetical protein [Marinobacter mobilis]|uniref:Uncharacterized protein n=1 Tax=Marinobacter mobilis TaxID=488533 RepID=A0A1H2UEG0_9GAMM|nr:hypothetical protein [Marinobacter mobilis]SDW54541.1 hypothetical protein SAMN04487960_10384 [Marinobacter mobilis]
MSLSIVPLSVVSLVSLLSWSAVSLGQPVDDALEGMRFDGVLRQADASSGGDKDQLVFEQGLFLSRACEAYGFGRAAYEVYEVEESGGQVYFAATVTSPTHGQMEWRGVVGNNRVEAEVVWTKERWYWDTRREYRFTGVATP